MASPDTAVIQQIHMSEIELHSQEYNEELYQLYPENGKVHSHSCLKLCSPTISLYVDDIFPTLYETVIGVIFGPDVCHSTKNCKGHVKKGYKTALLSFFKTF